MGISDGWIGRYAILARLGEGGMAETWLCRPPDGVSTPVVLKTLRPGCRSRQHQAMFRDEAMVGVALRHPNLPQVYEFGTTSTDGPYLVQQYVDGPNLMQLVRAQQAHGPPDLRLAARIVADVATALDHAYHARDGEGRPLYVIHRDVCPSNVLVGADGVTRVIDFGVAMYVGREARTEAGVLKGKLPYMAPEVLLDQDWSHRSDLYAVGMVLHWLLVGRPAAWHLEGVEATPRVGPNAHEDEEDVLVRLRGRLVPPSTHRPDLPRPLEDIVTRCLQLAPTRRYARGRHLAEDLEDWMRSEPGGLVSDAEVARKLSILFRDPRTDWRAGHDYTVGVGFLVAKALPAPSGAAHVRGWAGRSGRLSLVAGLVGAAILAWIVRPVPPPPAPEPQIGQLAVELAAVDAALHAGNVEQAARRLARLGEVLAAGESPPAQRRAGDRTDLVRRIEAVSHALSGTPDPLGPARAVEPEAASPDVVALLAELRELREHIEHPPRAAPDAGATPPLAPAVRRERPRPRDILESR